MRTDRPRPSREPGGPFTVLAVCTGNVARSPAVERLLRAALGERSGVRVTSAGTQALVGHPIAAPMADLLAGSGADPAQFAARQLDAGIVAGADLVLALTRSHRSAVVSLHPRALRRAFTLRELAALAQDLPEQARLEVLAAGRPADRLTVLGARALARRGHAGRDPADDDVVDPWRRDDAVYRTAFAQMADALDVVTGLVLP